MQSLNRWAVSVPSRGYLFFYFCKSWYFLQRNWVNGFRPLSGLCLFLQCLKPQTKRAQHVSVPSRGYVFFYRSFSHGAMRHCAVSVPSRGYVFFYLVLTATNLSSKTGFRPLSGLCLFLQSGKIFITKWKKKFPSPLGVMSFFTMSAKVLEASEGLTFPSPLGVMSFFTKWKKLLKDTKCRVSVPSRGYVFFYGIIKIVKRKVISFRPLSGLCLFLRKNLILYDIQMIESFRPLSGLCLFLLHPSSPAFFKASALILRGKP